MELKRLSEIISKKKFKIDENGTISIFIDDVYLLKMSCAELFALASIVSEKQMSSLEITKNIIDTIKNVVEDEERQATTVTATPVSIVETKPKAKSVLKKDQRLKFLSFLTSYLDDKTTQERFEWIDFNSVLETKLEADQLNSEFEDFNFVKIDEIFVDVSIK